MPYAVEKIRELDLDKIILDACSDDEIKKAVVFMKNNMRESNIWDAVWAHDRDENSYLLKIFEDSSSCIFLYFYRAKFYKISVLDIRWQSNPSRRMAFSKRSTPSPEMRLGVVEGITKAFAAHGLRGVGGPFDLAIPDFEGGNHE